MEPSKPAIPNQTRLKKRKKSNLKSSLREENGRSRSEGSRRNPRVQNTSRESSTGSSVMSLDVRCACQFFQSDSLLPERKNIVGAIPSIRSSNKMVHFRYVQAQISLSTRKSDNIQYCF